MPDNKSNNLDREIRPIVDAARTVWIRRLIDPSRGNSLLFYRNLRVGTLDLSGDSTLVGRLIVGEAVTLENLISELQDSNNANAGAGVKAESRPKIRNTLIALQRKALSNLEEKGIETLYLAIGMATWPAADGGRPYDSPVLLLPARIESRGRGSDELRVSVAGEPQINPVLLHIIEENYAIRINPSVIVKECCSEDESGMWRIKPESVFSSLEGVTKSVPGFEIKRRVILANFQFAKMAMVEDLKKNGDAITSSSVVAAVAGHSASRKKLSESLINIEPAQLDERPASDDYLVLDADSTQHRAIVIVAKGQSGVIQGPPGTGKSQTIANLIAQSVAEGRRVLFVAEKRAALEAVIKRLSHPNIGLGYLVLDLHGASVSRKQVMAQIEQSLDKIRHATIVNNADNVHREFEARRKELNEHARRMNTIRKPTGLSINGIMGRLLHLPVTAKSTLRIRGETFAALTAERVDEIRQWIVEGTSTPNLLLGTDPSPWNNADVTNGIHAQQSLDLAKRAAYEIWPDFERILGHVVQSLGCRPPSNLDETATLISVLRDVRRIREKYKPEIFSAPPGKLASCLERAKGGRVARGWALLTNVSYRGARKHMLSIRVAPAKTSILRSEALYAEDVLRRWQATGATSKVPCEAEGEAKLGDVFAALSEATKKLSVITQKGSLGSIPLVEIQSWIRSLANDQRTPYLLPAVHAIRSRFKKADLSRFLDDLRENKVAVEYWADRFEYVWLYSSLEEVFASSPSLASFKGRSHQQIVSDFNRLDRERVRLSAERVRRLHAERAIEAMNKNFDQTNLIRTEAHKKSRHIPIRELLARAPDVLTRIAPCWVASPLSVSQLINGGNRHFDIVIFDEASQILQEEAIPSLYRAEQVVVAGDRHQLPPTTFFATAVEGEDDFGDDDGARGPLATAAASIGGFESVLGTLEAFLPNWLLEWHYRSEDERLIAFSNTHIYMKRLLTFPSARGHEAIRHILVPHDPSVGGQEESASREVDEVVRQVLSHVQARPQESLGVITMGIKHANRIQAALDRAIDLRSELSDFFSLDREERFFVKNLETVQGDERDAIILSIGYGKSANGDLPHHFGPLTQDVGYRRLNVAVTRAKRRICVISSFSHNDIDLNRSGSEGVKLLKVYLEYAESGGKRLPEQEHASTVPLNAFEADVRDALEARWIKTRPQFGASRYRIDLVAMHPQKPGRPVLAIECDGASYHSSATARDRDRLRQDHLQRLGWYFHRIWSTDWFYNRKEETERAVKSWQEAVRRADMWDADSGRASSSVSTEPPSSLSRQAPGQQRGARPSVETRESIEQYSEGELVKIAEWITSDGLLRTDEELIQEIFGMLPFKRMGNRIRERLRGIAQVVNSQKRTAKKK